MNNEIKHILINGVPHALKLVENPSNVRSLGRIIVYNHKNIAVAFVAMSYGTVPALMFYTYLHYF
jgi:hypothetical protein